MMTKLEILLLVEDDDAEAQHAINVIRAVSANIAITRQKISSEALEYLRQVHQPPQLIVFDLGTPDNTDGIQFIRKMRTIDKLKPVPIVVMTGNPVEVAQAHAADIAAGYIVKPVEVAKFREQLDKLGFTT